MLVVIASLWCLVLTSVQCAEAFSQIASKHNDPHNSDAGAVAATSYQDIESYDVMHARRKKMELELPGYGHRLFVLSEGKQGKAEGKQ